MVTPEVIPLFLRNCAMGLVCPRAVSTTTLSAFFSARTRCNNPTYFLIGRGFFNCSNSEKSKVSPSCFSYAAYSAGDIVRRFPSLLITVTLASVCTRVSSKSVAYNVFPRAMLISLLIYMPLPPFFRLEVLTFSCDYLMTMYAILWLITQQYIHLR